MAPKTSWRVIPLLGHADAMLGYAGQAWAAAARLALAGYARRPRAQIDSLDDEHAAISERVSGFTEGLFETKKKLLEAIRSQPNGAALPAQIERLVTDASAILEHAHLLVCLVSAAASASLVGPESSVERGQIEDDVRKLGEAVHQIRVQLEQAAARIHDPKAVIRWRTAEAAGRLGLSVDEARNRVMARWRDP